MHRLLGILNCPGSSPRLPKVRRTFARLTIQHHNLTGVVVVQHEEFVLPNGNVNGTARRGNGQGSYEVVIGAEDDDLFAFGVRDELVPKPVHDDADRLAQPAGIAGAQNGEGPVLEVQTTESRDLRVTCVYHAVARRDAVGFVDACPLDGAIAEREFDDTTPGTFNMRSATCPGEELHSGWGRWRRKQKESVLLARGIASDDQRCEDETEGEGGFGRV